MYLPAKGTVVIFFKLSNKNPKVRQNKVIKKVNRAAVLFSFSRKYDIPYKKTVEIKTTTKL